MMAAIRTHIDIDWTELVQPHPSVPVPVAFEVYRWMVTTGREFSRWGWPGVLDLLTKKPSCINHSVTDLAPVTGAEWWEDLCERFQYAILHCWPRSPNGLAEKWREQHGIRVYNTSRIEIRHWRPLWSGPAMYNYDIGELVSRLLTYSGRFKASHNHCHQQARTVFSVGLCCRPRGWALVAAYGYACERKEHCRSSWDVYVAEQGKREEFTDFLLRGAHALNALVRQPIEVPMTEKA